MPLRGSPGGGVLGRVRRRALAKLGIDVELSHLPQEVPDPIPFPDDTAHRAYDPAAATRFWRVLTLIEPVFAEYRAAFEGKVSRVQFFWGHADLAVTRFSGEPCTPPPGAGLLERETYDYEQMSVGWWAGDESFRGPRSTRTAIRSPKASTTPTSACPAPRGTPSSASSSLDYDDVRAAPLTRGARSASSSTPPTPPAPPAATGTPASTPDPTCVKVAAYAATLTQERAGGVGQPTMPLTLRSTMVSQSRPSFSVRISSPCSLNSGRGSSARARR